MTTYRSFHCHLAYLAGSVLAHASEMVLGIFAIVVGLALIVTVYLMPVGAFVVLLGIILFMAGSAGTEAVWTHLREDYGAHRHVYCLSGLQHPK
jgi:hypothetical protein